MHDIISLITAQETIRYSYLITAFMTKIDVTELHYILGGGGGR